MQKEDCMKHKYDRYAPEGYFKIPVNEVWTNGINLILLGDTPEDDENEIVHNCDHMGCGSCGHVIFRINLGKDDIRVADSYRPEQTIEEKEQEIDYIQDTIIL
jgi:hypothetical protein